MTYSVSLSVAARNDFHRAQAYYDAAAPEQTRLIRLHHLGEVGDLLTLERGHDGSVGTPA